MLPITTFFFFPGYHIFGNLPLVTCPSLCSSLPSVEEPARLWLWLGVICLPPATSYSSRWLCRNSICDTLKPFIHDVLGMEGKPDVKGSA